MLLIYLPLTKLKIIPAFLQKRVFAWLAAKYTIRACGACEFCQILSNSWVKRPDKLPSSCSHDWLHSTQGSRRVSIILLFFWTNQYDTCNFWYLNSILAIQKPCLNCPDIAWTDVTIRTLGRIWVRGSTVNLFRAIFGSLWRHCIAGTEYFDWSMSNRLNSPTWSAWYATETYQRRYD